VEIDKNVAKLREEFETRTREAETLRLDLERANATLEKANNLMSKMSGEKVRWQAQVKDIKRDAELLSTHTCLAAAYCTYLGHFDEDLRAKANTLWCEKRGIDGFDFLHHVYGERAAYLEVTRFVCRSTVPGECSYDQEWEHDAIHR